MADSPQTLLGFDFGERRIGVAIGQVLTHTATPLTTLTPVSGKPDWSHIARLIEEWRPQALVVGLPLHMDASEMPMTQRARRFANQLNGRFRLPVHLVDERLSSDEAGALLKSQRQAGLRGKTKRGDDDRIAAALILQQWLEGESARS